MAKLLILTHAYAPDHNPRAFRWQSLAEAFVRQGHVVHVVTASGKPGQETLNGVTVHRVAEGGPGLLRQRLAAQTAVEATAKPVATSQKRGLLSRLSPWLRRLWRSFYWPDNTMLWVRPAAVQAEVLHRAHHFDGVISVSLPFSGHMAALKMHKKFPTLPWLVDVGDPFAFETAMPLNNQRLYKHLNKVMEGEVFRRASVVAVTTEGTRQMYLKFFHNPPGLAEKLVVIPPLVSLPEALPAKKTGNRLKLVFVGTLYRAIRSPQKLLELMEALERSPLSNRLEWHIIGNVHDTSDLFTLYTEAQKAGRLHLHGRVDRDAVAQYVADADVLVNIGNKTPYQLPSKVVEYVATGKPVLNFAPIVEDSSAAFFAGYPAALTVYDHAPLPENAHKAEQFLTTLPKPVSANVRNAMVAPYLLPQVVQAYLHRLGLA